mgnify:CR=1 FL=1
MGANGERTRMHTITLVARPHPSPPPHAGEGADHGIGGDSADDHFLGASTFASSARNASSGDWPSICNSGASVMR